ncbi:MAG: hypothetical protein IIY94_09295 [Oscillospiraceae bacterium]|nr:hypothetical protein [Oscillospiraceae bacterium]
MRRRLLAVPMMLCLCLLCACADGGNEPLQAALDYRTELLGQGGCAFELEAQADTGEMVWALTLSCALDAAGNGTVTVLAPESIAGISAVCEDGGASLRYEDLALGLGTLPDTELSPAQAPGRLVRAWAEAWINSAGAEQDGTLACYEDGDLTVLTWFNGEGIPTRAELAVNGQLRFSAQIRNFSWKAGNEHETVEENLG